MKKLFLTALTATVLITFGCKKTGGVDFASIVGRWRYSNSTTDTLTNGQWGPPQTGYDSSLVATLAESLTFTSTDTVYYTYLGITTWSNYRLGGDRLVLIGSASSDTLIIHSLSNTTLQLGHQNARYSYWANFSRY
jgi:hypothetical protein